VAVELDPEVDLEVELLAKVLIQIIHQHPHHALHRHQDHHALIYHVQIADLFRLNHVALHTLQSQGRHHRLDITARKVKAIVIAKSLIIIGITLAASLIHLNDQKRSVHAAAQKAQAEV
jgi:hypothetical protein